MTLSMKKSLGWDNSEPKATLVMDDVLSCPDLRTDTYVQWSRRVYAYSRTGVSSKACHIALKEPTEIQSSTSTCIQASEKLLQSEALLLFTSFRIHQLFEALRFTPSAIDESDIFRLGFHNQSFIDHSSQIHI